MGINTPSAPGTVCPVYAVRLTLPHGQYLDTTVIEGPSGGLDAQGLDGLLGRDVLQYAILVYLGAEAQFTLGF